MKNSALSDTALLRALRSWYLPEPLTVQRLPAGFSSEAWLVEAGRERFVAKYAYQSQEAFEGGLYAAELVAQHGIISGAPLRTRDGVLSVLVEGSHGQQQPLALLRFVPGEKLDPTEPGAPTLYGNLLGRTHTLLLPSVDKMNAFDVCEYLQQEDTSVLAQPGLAPLIRGTVKMVQDYEAQHTVTYGVIWGDGMDIRCERETGRVGIIDWGAIERGPLMFDVALSVLWLFPEGTQGHEVFLQAYLAEAPITDSELAGLDYYKALLWARQAKYFAYRLFANVTLGDPNPDGNAESLAESRLELERVLARL